MPSRPAPGLARIRPPEPPALDVGFACAVRPRKARRPVEGGVRGVAGGLRDGRQELLAMTSLAEERAEQSRWKLRAHCSGIDGLDRLVENEFTPPERAEAKEASALQSMVRFAIARVPYYRNLFTRLGLKAADISGRQDLTRLPLLTKHELREQFERLRPDVLPQGVRIGGITSSSGSTGPPTKVVHSVTSNAMFTFLNQRNVRWFRYDPARTVASIRLARANLQPRPGTYLADGETLRIPRWRYAGVYFETGPSLYFNITNPIEAQVAWLRRERPDYLIMRSHALEHLGLACAGERPCDSLLAVQAISEAIPPSTRCFIAATFGSRVNQGYGLNEIGLVATRCEADRYHAHREHCVVEIVDEVGKPCSPGHAGRIVVTGLQNFAMPLLRYDTDDLATVTYGPCPCGRTLPSFAEIHGRYSRIVGLPAGTLEHVDALRRALQETLTTLGDGLGLRRYQIHQFKDGSFDLRLASMSPIPVGLSDHLQRTWALMVGAGGASLTIRAVADIPFETVGDKFDDFVSDCL
jgi:phenylacetate-CoA ligase